MKNFILSTSGRILTAAFGVALAGSGAGKLLDGEAAIGAGSVAVILAVALAVVALATAIGEHFKAAVMAIVLLPSLLFLGEVGRGLLPTSGAAPLLIAGLALLGVAMRPRAAPEQDQAEAAVARSTSSLSRA